MYTESLLPVTNDSVEEVKKKGMQRSLLLGYYSVTINFACIMMDEKEMCRMHYICIKLQPEMSFAGDFEFIKCIGN